MIIEYHRPDSVWEAIQLLSRDNPPTFPLGGGTVLNRLESDPFAVVDLQALGLNEINEKKESLVIGATVTLQRLLNHERLYHAMKFAIRHEATYNLRQIGTVAGTLMASDGRSPFANVMLAVSAKVLVIPGDETVELGDFLSLRNKYRKGRLITEIVVPTNLSVSYKYVARTPADLPIVCVSVARWHSGRTRIALGGFGSSPLIAFDGPNHEGADIAARDAYSEAGDAWASAEYRSDIAATLVKRCLESIYEKGK